MKLIDTMDVEAFVDMETTTSDRWKHNWNIKSI